MAAFKAMFEEAERLIRTGGDSHKADDLCFRLLREPTLPLAYRAGCNLLLCFGTDKPVEFGEVSSRNLSLSRTLSHTDVHRKPSSGIR